jgi:hypothetical protein
MTDETNKESTPAAAEEKPKVKKKIKRDPFFVPPLKWAAIESAWKFGKFKSLHELSKEFGVPLNILASRFNSRGIKKSESIEAYDRKVQEEIDKKAKADVKLIVERIKETREEHYRISSNMAKLAWGSVIEAKQTGKPFQALKNDLDALEKAMRIIKMSREERFAVLGVGQEGEENLETLPELLVSELSEQDIEQLRNAQPNPDDSTSVNTSLITDPNDPASDDDIVEDGGEEE